MNGKAIAMITARKIAVCQTIVYLLLFAGCQNSSVIWSVEENSPDNQWIAGARTKQFSGPGTASVETTVYLRRLNNSGPEIEILSLANTSAYPPDITNVNMIWTTAKHLNLRYKGPADINFQAVKCAGIDIFLDTQL